MKLARPPALLTAALLALGCRDFTAPEQPVARAPALSHAGTAAGMHGSGSIGDGTATPGANHQDFTFDVAADLTGSLTYRDWAVTRADGSVATVTVAATDPETRITAFRDASDVCSDPARGAEFDGIGRLDTGDLIGFTVIGCDNGASGSGADGFRMSVPDAGGYLREDLLSSGDIVKSIGTTPPPANPEVSGLGAIGPGTATPGSERQEFDFDATVAPSGRLQYTDYGVVRGDGSVGRFVVDATTDAATGVTSYRQTSATCVQFGGTGRIDTGDLWSFVLIACDNANPGSGFDTFSIDLPGRGYARSGTLTSGDILLGEPPPATGDLEVTVATTGESIDPDGYTVTVDETNSQPIATTGGATFTGLSAGSHTVALSGLTTNCTVSGEASQTVEVTAGGTASATFSVNCAPLTGDLTVTINTSGVNLDPDGYTVTLDGANARPVGINGSVAYTGVTAGGHSVAISGLAANCTVSGGSSRDVEVTSGATASVSFAVTCEAGPAVRIAFTVQPSTTKANSTITPAVQVTAFDAQGNRATSFNGLVTIAIGRNGGGLLTPGRLSGTKTVRAVNGVATFSDLSIDRGGDYTLRVTSSGLTGAESQTFRIENSGLCLLVICL